MSSAHFPAQAIPADGGAALPLRAIAGPVVLGALVIAYASWLSLVAIPTNVDVSWLLIVCDRLLGGERLNTDMMEINPPFSIWLYMPFMLLEKLSGLRAELWLTLGIICLSLASLAVSARILARVEPIYRQPRALWAAVAALFAILVAFPYDFGQREQFALIAVLPWVALQCARQRSLNFVAGSPGEHIVAGLGAAVVVMVKPPYFALGLILPSLLLAFHRRSLKPLFVTENLLGAAIVAAYIAAIAIFDRAYLTDILPLANEVYRPLRDPFFDILANWPRFALLVGVATVLAAGGLRRLHWDVTILLVTALGFAPALLLMGKGWPNHALPMVLLATMAFGAQLLRTEGFRNAVVIRKAALVFGCALMLQLTIVVQHAAITMDNGPIERSVAAIHDVGENPTIVSVADRMQIAHPLTRLAGGKFVSRYPSAWAVLNAELLARSADEPERKRRLETLRDRVIGELAAEIVAKKPDVVLSAGPSWNALLLKDRGMAAALSGYEVLHAEPKITVYLRGGARRSAALSN